MRKLAIVIFIVALGLAVPAAAAAQANQADAPTAAPGPQTYQPKSASDKAHSDAEFTALAYMRTVVAAQKLYYHKHNQYAPSLAALVGSGSFTRRMAQPNRGDYTVGYRSKPTGYALTLTPRQFDAAHRSFLVDETGEFRADPAARATEKSPPLS